jgi:carboxylesterase
MKQNYYIKNPQLDGDDFFFMGSEKSVLLIHGFTSSTAEVRLLADKFHNEGFTVAGPLLPGHGTHPADLQKATWEMWLEKVKKTYETLMRASKEVYVLGTSMGALLALALASQHPEVKGLMLFAPAIKVKLLWLSPFLSLFLSYKPKDIKDDGLPWKGYTVNPYKAAAQLYKLQKHTKKLLPNIHQPLAVFTGGYDKTIAPGSAELILTSVQSEIRTLFHMPESGHTITIDREIDQAFEYLMAFIELANI